MIKVTRIISAFKRRGIYLLTPCVCFEQVSVADANNIIKVEIHLQIGVGIEKPQDGHFGTNDIQFGQIAC